MPLPRTGNRRKATTFARKELAGRLIGYRPNLSSCLSVRIKFARVGCQLILGAPAGSSPAHALRHLLGCDTGKCDPHLCAVRTLDRADRPP